jgi:hypothetical protein
MSDEPGIGRPGAAAPGRDTPDKNEQDPPRTSSAHWKPTAQELKDILERHRRWLANKEGGASAKLSHADLSGARLSDANLSYANLSDANLSDSNLSGAKLENVGLVRTNLEGATISNCRVYGISAWDVRINGNTEQLNLIVTPQYQAPEILVDDLEVAQFIYLLVNNRKIQRVIIQSRRRQSLFSVASQQSENGCLTRCGTSFGSATTSQ